MNFRSQRRRSKALVSIDITSLMDVVFLLLIFLLVTTVFRTDEHAFEIEFPTSSADNVVVSTDKTTVYVDKTGALHLLIVDEGGGGTGGDAKKVTPKELRQKLAELSAKKPDMSIGVKGDKATSYQAMVEVVGYIQDAGFKRVTFPYEFGSNQATTKP